MTDPTDQACRHVIIAGKRFEVPTAVWEEAVQITRGMNRFMQGFGTTLEPEQVLVDLIGEQLKERLQQTPAPREPR